MESNTTEALDEILTENQKKEIIKHNNIIRSLSTKELNLQASIDLKTAELTKLENNVQSLNKEIDTKHIKADQEIKAQMAEIEVHRKKVSDALDQKEKDLNLRFATFDQRQKEIEKENMELNQKKDTLEKLRTLLIDTINSEIKILNENVLKTVDQIKGI